MPNFQTMLFIDGQVILLSFSCTTALSGKTYTVSHPNSFQPDVTIEVQSASPEDVHKALEAASAAQPAWKSSLQRSEIFRKLARLVDEFKTDIVDVSPVLKWFMLFPN
jgi:acyl-CoA reductase-like NAD-dependent aldehyde dehydrogenase